MRSKYKIIRNIYRESMSTLIIIAMIFITTGHMRVIPHNTSKLNNAMVLETVELPSQNTIVEIPNVEISIDQLVQDVESGKAGNGEARKEYLGKYYDEVQTIINKRYESKPIEHEESFKIATSGNKAELQNYAYELVIAMGWSETYFQNLVKLWEKESNWNPNAHNKSSGAHGIPQSLPANKISTYGDDYLTNGETQIRWGLNYILNRYGTPTNAWKHSQIHNWY